MIQGKDIIYVNGDSFTEGCDIEDYLYPNFKKNYSLNELLSVPFKEAMERQMSSIEARKTFAETHRQQSTEYNQSRSTLRWSTMLQNILNKPVVNMSSQGGSSMYAIAYRTIADVVALKDQGYNITDIIIQITAGGRLSIFKNNNLEDEPPIRSKYHPDIKTLTYNIFTTNFIAARNTQYQSLVEQYILHETPDYTDYRVLHDLFTLKHALMSLTTARIIFVDSVFYKKTLSGYNCFTFKDCNLSPDNHIVQFKQQLDQDIKLSMLDCVEPDEPDTMTAGMHFTAKVHRRFAELIAETYFNE